MKKKIRDVRGGTGGGKTIGITTWDIDFAQSSKNRIIDVVSESYPHLDAGVMKDFKNIMTDRGYWNEDRWNEGKHFYKFETGSEIHFQSFDKLGKAHGPRRDVLHLNEANYLPWNVVDQLITRTRSVVWAEYNPSVEFWMQEQIIGRREDVESLKLTYLDNEGLSESEIIEIESHKSNAQWWKVYGLGEFGEIEGRIYKDWKIIEEIPHEARLTSRGLDFGYSNDPSALIDIYKYNGGNIWNETIYQKGLSNKQIADIVLNLPEPQTLIVADSAEPKSIDELRSYGLNVLPTTKGPGSVNQGIQKVQSKRISVTSRSINTIKEYRNYNWLMDKNGKTLNIPEDGFNHAMDAGRYGTIEETEENLEKRKEQVQFRRQSTAFKNRQESTQ